MPSVFLGRDVETGKELRLGTTEHRSGLYILGKPGMGKSMLMISIMRQLADNKHGFFFLDPHGDAIDDYLATKYYSEWAFTTRLFDLEDEEYSFGINLFSCRDIGSLRERTATYTRVYNVFYKLWGDNWGPWLQLILENTFWAFIENPEYTLAEVPMFLNPRNTQFRDYILSNVKGNPACVDFWKYEFFQRRERDQQERVEAALTRITTLLSHPYVRHIIGQQKTTVDFSCIQNPEPTYFLFRLRANLADDIKKFIGAIIMSELLHAIRNRPENARHHFGVFIDEFQHFTSNEDCTALLTEGRKFGVSTTICHHERLGQFADNQKLMGATLAAVNKVFFQLTVPDARELAPEFAKETTTTETRLERELVISRSPVADLLKSGHTNPKIQAFTDEWLREYQRWREKILQELEKHHLQRTDLLDEASFFRGDERIEGIGSGRFADSENIAIRRSAITSSQQSLQAARGETIEIQQMIAALGSGRDRMYKYNQAFTAIMEGGDISKAFMNLELESYLGIGGFKHIVSLYMAVVYGDPMVPQSIRLDFANTYGLFRDDVKKMEQNQEWVTLPDHLRPRVLSVTEREEVRRACIAEFSKEKRGYDIAYVQKVLNQYFEVCQLLSKPENHIKVPSGQYVEKQVHVRQVHDMTDEMTQELINLPRFTAYAKVIEESQGTQSVLKKQIKTEEVYLNLDYAVPSAVKDIGNYFSKKRIDIDDEIRKRQEKWRVVAPQTTSTPPEEPPPPTTF